MNNTTAIELGARCKRFRNVLGLSQQALGDRVGITGAAISKYEKEGLYNIEVIQLLSEALGHDLLADEIDEEGTVGVVGYEILKLLINSEGVINADELLESKDLYGMSTSRIVKELFKLEKIGMCVREQYTDFYDEEQDKVFVTAKGAIAYTHEFGDGEDISSFITYEKICGEHLNYQSYIEANDLEKRIRNIKQTNGFRANFIEYLNREFTSDFENPHTDNSDLLPGKGVYNDIMYSLVSDLTREDVDLYLEANGCKHGLFSEEAYNMRDKMYGRDIVESDFVWNISNMIDENEFHAVEEEEIRYKKRLLSGNAAYDEETDKKIEELNRKDILLEDMLFEKNFSRKYSEKLKEKMEETESMNPIDWYSKEAIEDYIVATVKPAETEDEMAVEKELIEIMEKYPQVLKYFRVSTDWLRNGLADIIREMYKIPKVSVAGADGNEYKVPKDVLVNESESK